MLMALVHPRADMGQRLLATSVLLGELEYRDLKPEDADAQVILHRLGIPEAAMDSETTRTAAMVQLRDVAQETLVIAFGHVGPQAVPPLVSRGPFGLNGAGQRETRTDRNGRLVEVTA